MNLKRVPCVVMDYKKSGVVLKTWKNNFDISVSDIFWMVKNNKKYPIKTTRHLFFPAIDEIRVPIALLY